MSIIYRETADLKLSPLVQSKLSSYMTRLSKGSDIIYRTPIGLSMTTDEILKGWDEIFNKNSLKLDNMLHSIELAQRDKFGPRSIAKPWSDIKENLTSSFSATSDEKFSCTTSDLKFRRNLRPASFTTALRNLKNSTSAGLPYLEKKGVVKEKYNEVIWLQELKAKYPAMPFIRTQEGGKTRIVWGVPISNIVLETKYYLPLFELSKLDKYRTSLLGPDEVNVRMTDFLLKARDQNLFILSIDFERYDMSITKQMVQCVFDKYYKPNYQNNKNISSDLDLIADTMSGIGIAVPGNKYTTGYHGLASGSMFTNDVGSKVQYDIGISTGLPLDIECNGDDGIILLKESDIDSYINRFDSLGLTVNKEKSYRSDKFCVFLQRYYSLNYIGSNGVVGGIYPSYRALCKIIFQERHVEFNKVGLDGKDYFSIRTILILENCKFHPYFKELVAYVYKLDKYSLRYSDEAVGIFSSFVFQTDGSSGQIVHGYSHDIGGIRDFETVKLINQLSKGDLAVA